MGSTRSAELLTGRYLGTHRRCFGSCLEFGQRHGRSRSPPAQAEAGVWLRAEPNERDAIPQPLLNLLVDAEPTVREAAARAQDEYWERTWGQEYLDRICHGLELGEPVLSLYRFGRALARTGDDRMQRELDRFREMGDFAPHVDWWLSRVCTAINKRWQEVTSKWPEPWVALEGTLFEFDGMIQVQDTSQPAHMTLWLSPRRTLAEHGSWGGVIRLTEGTPFGILAIAFGRSSTIRINIPGHIPADAIFAKSPVGGDGFLVTGTGPFPDALVASQPGEARSHGTGQRLACGKNHRGSATSGQLRLAAI